MTFKIDKNGFVDGLGEAVLCPQCNEGYTHQERVEIFDRKEDAEGGLHVVVENGCFFYDDNMSKNPSRRRQGLIITCGCEQCNRMFKIIIIQHKGTTYIETEKTEEVWDINREVKDSYDYLLNLVASKLSIKTLCTCTNEIGFKERSGHESNCAIHIETIKLLNKEMESEYNDRKM